MKSKTSKAKGAASRTKRSAGSQQRQVSCRLELSEAEIRHILEKFTFDEKGRYDGQTDKWTYPAQITGKLCRALRRAANAAHKPSGENQ